MFRHFLGKSRSGKHRLGNRRSGKCRGTHVTSAVLLQDLSRRQRPEREGARPLDLRHVKPEKSVHHVADSLLKRGVAGSPNKGSGRIPNKGRGRLFTEKGVW
jgi:hypothetical protein